MKETKQLRPIVRRAASSPSEFRYQHCISAPPVRGYLGKGSKGRKRFFRGVADFFHPAAHRPALLGRTPRTRGPGRV